MTTQTLEPKSILTKSQSKTVTKFYCEGKTQYRLKINMRYDDECGNGHNSFSITADLDEKKGNNHWYNQAGGCLHEDISEHAPELAHLIKWHLVSSDGPMHYVANTVYHASNRDCNGKLKGEKYHVKGQEEKRIVFGDFPISFKFSNEFTSWIEKNRLEDLRNVYPIPVNHEDYGKKEKYQFAPKYTLDGFACEWYNAPFNRKEEAQEFIQAMQSNAPRIMIFSEKFTEVGEGKDRQFENARACAVWPEATDAELSLEKPELEKLLVERLPALLEEFQKAMESLGFTY